MPPSLATLRTKAPSGAGWVHEIKFDGYRIQARLDRGKVRLLTRKGLDWTGKFPNVAAAVAAVSARTALVDGEVVILDAGGVSSFSGLQAALKAGERDRHLAVEPHLKLAAQLRLLPDEHPEDVPGTDLVGEGFRRLVARR